MKVSKKVLAGLLAALIGLYGTPDSMAGTYEIPPTFDAKDFLSADLLKGEHHEVEPQVVNDGYMNHYTIRSDFGTFNARSTFMARVRIREVSGISELMDMSQSEAFAGALTDSAKKTAESAARAITDPVGTAKGIPEGVGRMFKRMANTAGKVVDSAGEALSQEGAASTGDSADKADKAGKELAGINKAKRRLAKSVGVDPYSTNPALGEELDRLAPAAMGGGFAARAVTAGIPLAGELTKVSGMVWDSSPGDLEVAGREGLAKMGVPEERIDAFYKAPHLTVTSRVAVVTILEAMTGLAGRPEAVRLASQLRSEEEVRFFISSLVMLKGCHETQGPLERVLAGPAMPWGARGDGTLVLAFAFDRLSWTENIATAARRIDGEVRKDPSLEKVELWSAGSLSPRSKKELENLGWKVHEKAAGKLGVK